MKINGSSSNCGGCPLHRREFLTAACGACGGMLGLSLASRGVRAAESKKPRVRILYALHAEVQPGPDWPNVGFDFRPVMAELEAALAKGCPEVEFVASMANGPEQAKKIVSDDADKNIAGYFVYQLNCWNQVVQTAVETGKPVLYADFLYAGSGGFLVYTANLSRTRPNFGFIASSRLEDVVKCARQFASIDAPQRFGEAVAAVRRSCTPGAGNLACKPDSLAMLSVKDWREAMKGSKILLVGRPLGGRAPGVRESLGIEVVETPFQAINDAWKAADKDQAKEVADTWQSGAAKIADVSRAELENSAAMYLGMKAVLKKEHANAITVNCLGGFYGGHIHAYPCLGFHELCNEGLVGGCEADLRSAVTMVALSALTQGRTGFISDPVMDVAARQIIYAHCVASNRPFGPQGPRNPFEILTHSEDRKGAAIRSLMPEGYMTTTVEFEPARKEILFHQGKSVGNDLNDRACRTKLAVEPVGDFEKLFREWGTWGWHRVTAYGDLKEPIFALAEGLGWKVVEEA